MKISLEKVKDMYLAIVVLWVVLMSKTYYFGVVNKSTYQYIFYFFGIIGIFLCGARIRKIRNGIMLILPMIFLFVTNLFINMFDMSLSSRNQVIGIMITSIVTMFVSTYISKEKFSTYYIRIMTIMCLVSLPCWLLANISPDTARLFCQPGYDWRVKVGYSFFYTWGWNGTIYKRNSGMFWEPGAFQGFIVIAILMLLFETDKLSVKRRKELFFLYIVTLLTTKSTTGYIILIIIFVTLGNRIEKIVGNTNKNLRRVFILIISVIVLYFVFSSGNIENKFSNIYTDSANIRLKDFRGGILMCLRSGFIGLGETYTKNQLRSMYEVSMNDSVGLVAMIYTYGIFFGMYYIGLMIRGVKSFFQTKDLGENSFIIIILFILQMTEGVWWLPVYLMLIFCSFLGSDNLNERIIKKSF